MGSMSIGHWLVVALIVLLLFGRGKIPELLGDVAKGIKTFKAGLKDEEHTDSAALDPKKELTTQTQEGVGGASVKAEPLKTEGKTS